MSTFGCNRPMYLKTYGRQKRKVDLWFSPDLRKKAFSFSSTPSSDQSVSETSHPKARKKKSAASAGSRTARRAMTALKKLESDEENFIPDSASRNKVSSTHVKATVPKKPPGAHGARARTEQAPQHTARVKKRRKKKKQQVLSSSENEDESFMMEKKRSEAFRPGVPEEADRREKANALTEYLNEKRESAAPLPLGRFVTRRRRAPPIQPEKPTAKQSWAVPDGSLSSLEDFVSLVPSFPRCVARRKRPAVPEEFCPENSGPKRSASALSSGHTQSVLREVSLNDSEGQRVSCKLPLLSSTPSLVSRRNLRYLEPSVSEISSFSCDELDKPPAGNPSTSKLMIKPRQFTSLRNSQQRSSCTQEMKTEERAEGPHLQTAETLNRRGERTEDGVGQKNGESEQENMACEDDQMSASVIFVSAQTHLDSEVEQLKERCRSVSAVVLLEEVDVTDILSRQSLSRNTEDQETYPPSLETELSTSASIAEIGNGNQTYDVSDRALSDVCLRPLRVSTSPSSSSSLSVPPLSSPPAHGSSGSAQALIDRLTVECLSSCLTVFLQPLDHSLLHRFQQAPSQTRTASPPPQETRSDDQVMKSALQLENTERVNSEGERSSGSEGQKAGVVRRLSNLFGPPVSPADVVAPSKACTQVVPKERNGAGTGRKACVSGLSVSRWSKRDMGERNKRQRRNETRTRTKPGDCSLNYLQPAGTNGDSVCSWLNGGVGLPVTPIRVEQLNLSSILANFSPDMLTTHNWGRLKAALSVHKKKTAFPTPRRLALSNLRTPGGMDASLSLFGSPLDGYTPTSRLTPSRLLRSTMTDASVAPDDEDISDAEKVYHECQQDGPLPFDDCIPPEQMKRCSKIGEGTFGEVFSTVNDSSQTVALKIIPVEGSQKVNGEPQKTFGEILHEIIISKELSSLDSKENNRTSGFIGLNNLHCVRGCYPSALLKAWDKFDQEKGSENDRPDFFGQEQLFVILEFEFGGSDLENMNGKLSSMAQARSVLHQVTAALAVAEQALCFEHRDLHWGNILVKTTKEKHNDFVLNGSVHSVETRGVHVNIIDYSLSRLEIDGLTVSCDIANDEELFMGQGDYQFEIYRLMKKENNNCWGEYNPHSNVLWLHYLVDKLLTMKYKTKAQTGQQKALKSSLRSFQSEILSYGSATEALLHCSLFQ
ncbi:serine/threonine-protein kinase haspin [Colossoma macropomum]|uniref:serine/threonine-protein kinase haspin n=1 Tax=Colossoma macropomum TaxID=42526 RepID=UPI001865498D|nr:serine/threonine-protein kinase haspin [Colossoma macropomum]